MKTVWPAFLGLVAGSLIYFTLGAVLTGPSSETVSTPIILNAISTGATNILATRTNDPAGRTLFRTLQNVSTIPVLYALGTNASLSNYHGILPPGTTNRDGRGLVVDISPWRGPVSIVTESGTGTVSAVELLK